MRFVRRMGMLWLMLCAVTALSAGADSPVAEVMANENRTPGGELKNGVLTLHLELRKGRWYPGAEGGIYRDVYAFAEEGKAAQTPGPLIRVPQGTQIHLTIRNTLPMAAKIYGLHSHPGDANEAMSLAAGETREVQFATAEPGTYLYWAATSNHEMKDRDQGETMLSGAFVVDSPGAKVDDRIMVIGLYSNAKEELLSINGKSWPYTERLTYKVRETTHWRVLNPSISDHAMHLHGFFFYVDGVGDGERFEEYSKEQRRFEVTEHVDIGHVFDLTWQPDREGNWLFHCHMVAHMMPLPSPEPTTKPAGYDQGHDADAGMGGLVMGITILPGTNEAEAKASAPGDVSRTAPAHKVQLVISDNPDKVPLYKVEINDSAAPADTDSKNDAKNKDAKKPTFLGPPIVLVRGEPAEIEVKNESTQDTSIHWHGMELESYYDGVAGWTGYGKQITPAVAPGGSFVARMTPPRAGTFIYHSHSHNVKQLTNGVYGPLIVLEPGQKYDPEHDKTFIFGLAKYSPLPTMMLINGVPEPYPMKLQVGTPYRFRLINITDNLSDLGVRLISNDAPVQWKIIAKDGADLPAVQVKTSFASMTISVGETYDVEYQADKAGEVELQIWYPDFPIRVTQALTFGSGK
jgi:manganese oxidase